MSKTFKRFSPPKMTWKPLPIKWNPLTTPRKLSRTRLFGRWSNKSKEKWKPRPRRRSTSTRLSFRISNNNWTRRLMPMKSKTWKLQARSRRKGSSSSLTSSSSSRLRPMRRKRRREKPRWGSSLPRRKIGNGRNRFSCLSNSKKRQEERPIDKSSLKLKDERKPTWKFSEREMSNSDWSKRD